MLKTLALLIAIALVGAPACSGTATPKQAASQFLDCSKANISAVLEKDGPSIFAMVLQIIMQGQVDWQGQLESLGQVAGIGELACAVTAVESLLVAHGDGTPITAGLTPQAARALAFLQSHPEWKFVALSLPATAK